MEDPGLNQKIFITHLLRLIDSILLPKSSPMSSNEFCFDMRIMPRRRRPDSANNANILTEKVDKR